MAHIEQENTEQEKYLLYWTQIFNLSVFGRNLKQPNVAIEEVQPRNFLAYKIFTDSACIQDFLITRPHQDKMVFMLYDLKKKTEKSTTIMTLFVCISVIICTLKVI